MSSPTCPCADWNENLPAPRARTEETSIEAMLREERREEEREREREERGGEEGRKEGGEERKESFFISATII